MPSTIGICFNKDIESLLAAVPVASGQRLRVTGRGNKQEACGHWSRQSSGRQWPGPTSSEHGQKALEQSATLCFIDTSLFYTYPEDWCPASFQRPCKSTSRRFATLRRAELARDEICSTYFCSTFSMLGSRIIKFTAILHQHILESMSMEVEATGGTKPLTHVRMRRPISPTPQY